MKDKIFEISKITSLMEEIDAHLDSRVEVLLIGGGAMSLRGDKEATKDIDIVVLTEREYDDLIKGLGKIGFIERDKLGAPYENMNASVLIDKRGFWIDLFLRRICKKFLVSERSKERGSNYGIFEKLKVTIMSREDIFLSKSITERDGDLDDMFVLYRRGLNLEVLVEEMEFQDNNTGQIWEAFMTVKLEELEERFDITVPFKEKVRNIAENKMVEVFEIGV